MPEVVSGFPRTDKAWNKTRYADLVPPPSEARKTAACHMVRFCSWTYFSEAISGHAGESFARA